MQEYPEGALFVFVDDAHTFGGTQIALAWTISALLQETSASVLCVCTAKTRAAVEEVVRPNPRLQFELGPAALPLNLFRFPQRLLPYWRLLRRIRSQGPCVWWLNLPDIEFGLAPLLVLRAMGEFHHTYLHGTTRFSLFYNNASWKRRVLSHLRDAVAEGLVFRLHRCLIVPSRTSQIEVESRIRSRKRNFLGYLLYPSEHTASILPSSVAEYGSGSPIPIWMIGNIVQGHKNNRAALEVLEALERLGYPATLTIAGVGPDLREFQMEAAKRNLCNRITYLGWISEPCTLAPKDAVVFIPSFHETLNLVAREAMRNGLRLVTSPIAVFREWIPAPLIAESFSPEAFAAKILQVREISPEDLATLFEGALAPFSRELFVKNFLAIPKACRRTING